MERRCRHRVLSGARARTVDASQNAPLANAPRAPHRVLPRCRIRSTPVALAAQKTTDERIIALLGPPSSLSHLSHCKEYLTGLPIGADHRRDAAEFPLRRRSDSLIVPCRLVGIANLGLLVVTQLDVQFAKRCLQLEVLLP